MLPFTKLNSTDRQDLSAIIPLPKPFTVLIEPSSLCNFRCIQCFQSISGKNYFNDSKGNMSVDDFCRIIDGLKNWNGQKLKVLKLCIYGEPFVNKDFCTMLKIAKEAGIAERIETTTNASLLTQEIAENLVKYQLDYLRVSIYSPFQDKHDIITGVSFPISEIHNNLLQLRRIKERNNSTRPFVCCKMLDSYDDEVKIFRQNYIDVADEIFIDKPHGWIHTNDKNFLESYYQEKYKTACSDLSNCDTKQRCCPMGFTTMSVRSNGDVFPCCVDFLGGTKIANISEGTLEEIWNSDKWKNFQRMQLDFKSSTNSSCRNCDFFHNGHYIKDNIDNVDSSII